MKTHYDTTQPRVIIAHPNEPDREREIGQAEALGEATFWLNLGYTVRIAEWDGNRYANRRSYCLGDL